MGKDDAFCGHFDGFCRQVPLPPEEEEGVTFATVPFFSLSTFPNSERNRSGEEKKIHRRCCQLKKTDRAFFFIV